MLEQRVLLDASFPDLTDLVDLRNTVVRFETSLGEIDFELYDAVGPGGGAAAPVTVENFLNYIQDGDFFNSFFHRSVDVSSPGFPVDGTDFVLQGGGFIFTDEDGLSRVPTDDPIANEFSADRSNVVRSLAMARITSIGPDTATSQFFVNLQDNNGSVTGGIDLDAQEFTVFGRVANDRSWGVVQAITGLDTFVFADVFTNADGDLVTPEGFPTSQPFLLPDPGADVVSLALTDVPVRVTPPPITPGELRSTSLAESFLVTVSDAEVIKPVEAENYFTFLAAYPEGYANDTSVTYVEVTTNQAGMMPVDYQVVLRYETGVRDQVIATGQLQPGRIVRVPISDPSLTDVDQARKFTPFAIEVQGTGAISASLTHTDQGATQSESFINATDLDARGAGAFLNWDFAGLRTTIDADSDGVPDNVDARESYIVWQNLTDEPGTVTLTAVLDAATRRTITFDLEGNRRGGAELHSLFGFETLGAQAIRVTSSVEIVAAMSNYDRQVDPADATTSVNAYGALGIPGGGTLEGVAAGVQYTADPDDEAYVSFFSFNPTGGAVVQLEISDSSGFAATTPIVLAPRDVGFYNLKNLLSAFGGVFTPGEMLTLRYESSRPISAQLVSTIGNETLTTSFQTQLSNLYVFAGGFDAGAAGGTEVLSLYNPYSAGTDTNISIIVQFFFVDRNQTISFSALPELEPGERVDLSARDFSDIESIITLGEDYGRYTIVVSGVALPPGAGARIDEGQFAATLTRIGPDGTLSGDSATVSTGSYDGFLRDLDDGLFDGTIGG
ncbi:MAG: peptidylprolyl isomerase [Planctomycetota bacterium]